MINNKLYLHEFDVAAAAAGGGGGKYYVFDVVSLLGRVMKLRSQNSDKNHPNHAAWFNEPGTDCTLLLLFIFSNNGLLHSRAVLLLSHLSLL